MDGDKRTHLLDALSAKVEARWEASDEDRRMFFRGLRHLQEGDLEAANAVFRRAVRRCEGSFSIMARMAQGRCEAARGRQGVALRIFQDVAESKAPETLRQMAWMEVADLARWRDDEVLLTRAREAISATAIRPEDIVARR